MTQTKKYIKFDAVKFPNMLKKHQDIDPQETQEWIESIEDALEEHGYERTRFLLETLIDFAQSKGARLPFNTSTPFLNTILPSQQPEYPGDREIERKIKTIVRWNAMAMVAKANKEKPGIGGHISTFASAATLYEVAFNHFFKGPNHPSRWMVWSCLLYTSPSPRDKRQSRMPSSA